MKKGDGVRLFWTFFFMTAGIASGFIVGPIGKSPDTSDLMRIFLALIPISFFLVALLLIWFFSKSALDELQDLIRMKGMLYGWAFSFVFFMIYGTLQMVGMNLPSFTGFGAIWVIGISAYFGQFIVNLRYR